MEVFDIIATIHDLSQKGAEFNEEIQNLRLTVMTLGAALENIGKTKKNKRFGKVYDLYNSVLEE